MAASVPASRTTTAGRSWCTPILAHRQPDPRPTRPRRGPHARAGAAPARRRVGRELPHLRVPARL